MHESGKWKLKVKLLSRVRLLATPWTAAHQASQGSKGFSRQEYWSGLPFPAPTHESESEVAQSCPALGDPMAPPSMGFSRQEYWSGVPLPSPGDLPDPGIEPRSSASQADTLPSEPPGFFAVFPYSPLGVCRFCSDNLYHFWSLYWHFRVLFSLLVFLEVCHYWYFQSISSVFFSLLFFFHFQFHWLLLFLFLPID